MICKPLRFQHAEAILTYARKSQQIIWEGHRIIFTQDYSKETIDTRKTFHQLRPKLREQNIQFSFVGPARFKIHDKGKHFVFSDPRSLICLLEGSKPQDMDLAEQTENLISFPNPGQIDSSKVSYSH